MSAMQGLTARAVLIDLDGTLADTAPDLAHAANAVRADAGLPPLPESRIEAFVGKGVDTLLHRALTDDLDGRLDEARFAPAQAAFRAHYHEANGRYSRPFEGALGALGRLRAAGLRVACVTNKAAEFTLPLLASLGATPLLDAVACADEVPRGKPHPDVLLEACRRLGVAPAQAIMVGDSLNDAQAAAAAGCPCLLVRTGYNEGEPIDSLAEFPGVAAILPGLPEAAGWILGPGHGAAP
jgi:phosphoglycolate phosphatase